MGPCQLLSSRPIHGDLWRKYAESGGAVGERNGKDNLTIFTYSSRSHSVRAKNEGER